MTLQDNAQEASPTKRNAMQGSEAKQGRGQEGPKDTGLSGRGRAELWRALGFTEERRDENAAPQKLLASLLI